MRRWTLLALVTLLMAALVAAVLNTPSRAMAARSSLRGLTAPSTNFKGKVVAKDTTTHYFVLSFTCSGGTLSAGWTYEVSSTQSFSGTVGSSSCALVPATTGTGVSYTPTPIPLLFNGTAVTNPGTPPPPATLALSLTNIAASKTFFGTFVASQGEDCASSATSPPPCVAVQTSDDLLIIPTTPTPTIVPGFSLVDGSFSTLNLSSH
jgi:hypothetical protein